MSLIIRLFLLNTNTNIYCDIYVKNYLALNGIPFDAKSIRITTEICRKVFDKFIQSEILLKSQPIPVRDWSMGIPIPGIQ